MSETLFIRLDYLSCFLTVVATILVGRKMWTVLIVSGVNSLVLCAQGDQELAVGAYHQARGVSERGAFDGSQLANTGRVVGVDAFGGWHVDVCHLCES